MADISTLTDTFDGATINDLWGAPTSGYQSTALTQSGGAMRYADGDLTLYLVDAYNWESLSGTQWHIEFPTLGGQEFTLRVGNLVQYAHVTVSNSGYVIGQIGVNFAEPPGGGGSDWGTNASYGIAGDWRYLRAYRRASYINTETITVEASTDGTDWQYVISTVEAPVSAYTWTGFHVQVEFGGFVNILDVHGITVSAPDVPPDDPPDDPPALPTVYDPFLPEAVAPTKPGSECATLLELVREFSAQVRRSVRITGPASIAMVDPNGPLPTWFNMDDADGMYRQTSQQLTANGVSLSALKGTLALTMGAEMVADDVRVVTSDWRIPQRLPVYGLDPAAVQRISYTFTPRHFSGTVEFRAATVPLSVRR